METREWSGMVHLRLRLKQQKGAVMSTQNTRFFRSFCMQLHAQIKYV
jgi:hypothetical protein